MTELGLVDAIDAVTAGAPRRDMIVWGAVRRSYADVADRSTRLASHLLARGLSVRRERAELERWECGQSPVALVMGNRPEYLESMYACYRARAVPFNVNHHYRPVEVRALFDMVGPEGIVYERRLGALVAEATDGLDVVLVDVDDGSGSARLDGAVDYEDAIAAGAIEPDAVPSPDDLYMVCTGGTTGRPKAVLWRQGDIGCSGMALTDGVTTEQLTEVAAADFGERWFAAPPLMHAAAQWTAFSGLHLGATIVLHDDSARFDAAAILRVIEREQVTMMSIVGDAYATPMIEEIRRGRYDLSSLVRLGVGGAVTSEANKQALLELLPGLTIIDGYGASETGGMAYGASTADAPAAGFAPGPGAVVLSEDRTRVLDPGDDEIGWTARRRRVPLGYLGDRQATEATFPVIDGQRFAVPGDRATMLDDGSIALLGRDSMVVNTGGEKVFVEEVEEVLRDHPDVADALVVGRPSQRFGQEVVGIVQLRPDAEVDAAGIRDHCGDELARFKAPRAVAFVETIGRHPSGKPDYGWAREAAAGAVDATAS